MGPLSRCLGSPRCEENYSGREENFKRVEDLRGPRFRLCTTVMSRRVRPCLVIVALWFAAPVAAAEVELSELLIVSASGRHAFMVEVADTPEERAIGLMFRRSLDPGRGMLFDYRHDRPASMWMKNTYVSLDMLFIAADGRVVSIAENAVPGSLDTIASVGPVRAVLEISAGTVARLGIAPADRVVHRIFGGGG